MYFICGERARTVYKSLSGWSLFEFMCHTNLIHAYWEGFSNSVKRKMCIDGSDDITLCEEEAICDATSNQKQQQHLGCASQLTLCDPPWPLSRTGERLIFTERPYCLVLKEREPWNRAVHEIVVYYFCMCVCVSFSFSLWTRNNTHLLWLLGNLCDTASLYRPWPAHNVYSWTIIRRIKKEKDEG